MMNYSEVINECILLAMDYLLILLLQTSPTEDKVLQDRLLYQKQLIGWIFIALLIVLIGANIIIIIVSGSKNAIDKALMNK